VRDGGRAILVGALGLGIVLAPFSDKNQEDQRCNSSANERIVRSPRM
jgi:hypothetical protein